MVVKIKITNPAAATKIARQIELIYKRSNASIKREAYEGYRKLAQSVARAAPRSMRAQRFSRRKGRVLVPLSNPTTGAATPGQLGFRVQRTGKFLGQGQWKLYLNHSDKNSLLHLIEFGTIGTRAQPFLVPTWKRNYKGIISTINNRTLKLLRQFYGNKVVRKAGILKRGTK